MDNDIRGPFVLIISESGDWYTIPKGKEGDFEDWDMSDEASCEECPSWIQPFNPEKGFFYAD